ncbi:hypothetical protein C2S53_019720 [Perilla frutescens var. hirtella]|uniref:Uncharacterized protein n=1 Tax=Perilla frutescens var. hirtella TaxID=608512 RepID=A0AAD4IUR8_PERFH|nr:hypothetical protein C2S53_019720 [Perilla frutescens var. hirtella]
MEPTLNNSIPISTKEVEDDLRASSSAALLSATHHHSSSSHSPKKTAAATFVFISLVISTAVAFTFLFFSASPPSSRVHLDSTAELSRPLSKLKYPVVLIISSDGFRFGYQYKTHLPNINRLINNGTEAQRGLIPVFPTLTFPNHYSIITGLHPAYNGIINNYFTDPVTGEKFNMGSHEPEWCISHGFEGRRR